MWIFTTSGFVSAVLDSSDRTIIVRRERSSFSQTNILQIPDPYKEDPAGGLPVLALPQTGLLPPTLKITVATLLVSTVVSGFRGIFDMNYSFHARWLISSLIPGQHFHENKLNFPHVFRERHG